MLKPISYRRMRRPAYFCPERPRPATSSPQQRGDEDHPDWRRNDRQGGGDRRGNLDEDGQQAARVGVQAGTDASEQRQGGGDADRGAHDPQADPDPLRVVAARDRAAAQQRADRQAEQPEHDGEQPAVDRAASGDTPLDEQDEDRPDEHDQQEQRLLEESEVGVVEGDLDVAGGERAGDQARQEGPDADGCGHANALEDVEDEVHGCGTVTERDDIGTQPARVAAVSGH